MSDDEVALHARITETPGGDAPWLVYADWLRERGWEFEADVIQVGLKSLQKLVGDGWTVENILNRAVLAMWPIQKPSFPDGATCNLPPILPRRR